jgi:hypothetical protein
VTCPSLGEVEDFLRETYEMDSCFWYEEREPEMRIELELPDTTDWEWDVWGGEVDQEDGEHFATFDRFESAVEYKAEMEEAQPRLHLRIQRRAKRVDVYADPFADDPPEGAEVEHCGTVTLEELDRLFEEGE